MSCIRHKAIDFLHSYGMDCCDVDFDANPEMFIEQMDKGLAGDQSTLEMIPTFLSASNEIPTDQPVIVADAGGTNFRIATVYFDQDNNPIIEKLEKFKMPGTEHELSRDDFFQSMAAYFHNVLSDSEQIGFCFSYPAHMQPNKDGRLVRFSKEIKAPEVIGELIGENLTEAIVSMRSGNKKSIVILNDTVATLLAGVGYKNRNFSSYIGFILGTGTNTSYIEHNAKISKQDGLANNGNMIINIESGNMGYIHRGKLDEVFDASTNNPGVYTFEKMISGAYLGPLTLLTMQQCAEDGLLCDQTSEAIRGLSDLDTKDLDDFMGYPYRDNPLAKACGSQEDAQLLYAIADRLIERAAKLTAINLSAAAIKTGQGADPTKPICVIADGTTYYHMKNLRSSVEYYLKQHLENERGIYTDIIHVENAPLIGAAIAGLTN